MRLHLTGRRYSNLRAYLFAPGEPIAFLFTQPLDSDHDVQVVDLRLLNEHDYLRRNRYRVEVADHVRPELILTAHRHGYAVVEAHAHGWPGNDTRFSSTDLDGLRDLGPHMIWRLPGRPYTALVLGPDSFDALQWLADGAITTIESLVVDGEPGYPTGLSLPRIAEPSLGSKP
jgi:hypothetical protein